MEEGRRLDPAILIGPEKVKQAVTCPICLMVVTLPIYRCEECGNHFCQKCLSEWWTSHGKEPEKHCVYNCERRTQPVMQRICDC